MCRFFVGFFAMTMLAVGTGAAGENFVSPKQVQEWVKNGQAVLVDVREKEELKNGMAEGARWFPFSKVSPENADWVNFVGQLPKDKKIVFYCAVGGRAGKVGRGLRAAGFSVENMGGFSLWQAAGLPVQKSQPKE